MLKTVDAQRAGRVTVPVMGRTSTRLLRAFALWAMLSPFVLLSLIAPGVMPARAQGGVLMLVICDGAGMTEIAVDPRTLQPVETSPDHDSGPCFWGLGHSPVDLVAPVEPLPVAMRRLALDFPPAATALIVARATGLPPATGPPLV